MLLNKTNKYSITCVSIETFILYKILKYNDYYEIIITIKKEEGDGILLRFSDSKIFKCVSVLFWLDPYSRTLSPFNTSLT